MPDANHASRACLRFGWTALAVFMILGLVLESLHLFKTPAYFEVRIRRELWTLAHAHGGLLAIVTIVFGLYARRVMQSTVLNNASIALRTGALLLPTGFFAGGIGNSETDPSLAILLVPVGALLVIYAVVIAAWLAWRADDRNQVPAKRVTQNPQKNREKKRAKK